MPVLETNPRGRLVGPFVGSACSLLALAAVIGLVSPTVVRAQQASLELEPCTVGDEDEPARCGTFEVWENRDTRSGRRINLDVMVLPALGGAPLPDPIVPLSGGPGQSAIVAAGGWSTATSLRQARDILLVSQRGTGGDNRLDCQLDGSAEDLQGYLGPAFRSTELFRACAEALSENYDLRWYTTSAAADDLNEIRAALGYERINIRGGSYGTRAALVYMRRHPETVRTALLDGVAPIAFKNPLYHSAAAQQALERTFAQCAADAACNGAFPNLAHEFQEILMRLDREPARVEIEHPDTGAPVQLVINRDSFAEALRVFMYYMPRARRVPLLIHRAYEGDLVPFANAGLGANRGILEALAMGMLMSVVCSEDVPRIEEYEIERATHDTFLGETRVRTQTASCAVWPRGVVPENHGDPVALDVPTLVVSGNVDPVTAPNWGDETVSHLPNGLHLEVPGAHGVAFTPCVSSIVEELLEEASVADLDTSCIADMELPPFELQRP